MVNMTDEERDVFFDNVTARIKMIRGWLADADRDLDRMCANRSGYKGTLSGRLQDVELEAKALREEITAGHVKEPQNAY